MVRLLYKLASKDYIIDTATPHWLDMCGKLLCILALIVQKALCTQCKSFLPSFLSWCHM